MAAVEAFDDRIDLLESSVGKLETSIGLAEDRLDDIETSIGGLIRTATMAAAAENGVATVNLTKTTDAGTTSTDSYTITGDAYIDVSQSAANALTLITKLGDIATATEDASGLATAHDVSAFVKSQIQDLEGALIFRGGAASDADLPDDAEKGDVYVATAGWTSTEAGATIEAGDLLIRGNNAWVVVERNLDGAVTSGDTLAAGYMVQGADNQAVATSTVSLASLVDVSNNAIRTATASGDSYVSATTTVSNRELTVTVAATTASLTTVTAPGSLADAKDAKDYVDAQVGDVSVQYTLNTSTADYVTVSSTVSDGLVISSSVGVKTATLADASNGGANFKALADARDVYEELTKVEEVMAAANAAMATTIGLNSDYSVTWSTASGLGDASIVAAIEQVAAQAAQSGVTSFGTKKGDISIDSTVATDGSVAFAMDGSTLKGTVVGWSGLVTRVSNNESSIGEVSTRVNEVSTRLNDLSTYVHTTVDTSVKALETKVTDIDASIDRLDTSVSALETWKNDSSFVNTVEGEAVVAGANTTFVYVNANPSAGDVNLTSGVVLATNSYGTTSATGLATDAYVQDFMAWEVIGGE